MSSTSQNDPRAAIAVSSETDASSCDSGSDFDDEFEDALPPSAASLLRIPPLNFANTLPGVFRSGYPHRRNFEYLRTIGLKSVLYAFVFQSHLSTPTCILTAQNSALAILSLVPQVPLH